MTESDDHYRKSTRLTLAAVVFISVAIVLGSDGILGWIFVCFAVGAILASLAEYALGVHREEIL